jgi:2-phosphosulfolactate phosphatase
MFYHQAQFGIRFEWGERGAIALAPISDILVIVDILSFSTCVDIATARGATVFPYRWKDSSAHAFAAERNATVAVSRGTTGQFSLSPASLENIPTGIRLVLPSPNGAALSFCTGNTPTLCGCLRNCRAVADYANQRGRRIAVIAAGERWEDGTLRVSVEDLIGAGAIIQYLSGRRSPEADAAKAAFEHASRNIPGCLGKCASGQELLERGFPADVALAAAVNCSDAVPLLKEEAYSS